MVTIRVVNAELAERAERIILGGLRELGVPLERTRCSC
jgi:hypothetical protein